MGEFLKTVSPQEKGRKPESLKDKTERLTVPEEREKYAEMRADQAKFEAELQSQADLAAAEQEARALKGSEKAVEMAKQAGVKSVDYIAAKKRVERLQDEIDNLNADLQAIKAAPKSIFGRLFGSSRGQENAIMQEISKKEAAIQSDQETYIGPVEGMVEAQSESAQVLEMGEEGIVRETMEEGAGASSGRAGKEARERQQERAKRTDTGIKGITR